MPEYNCYIVDDESESIEILQDYINQTPDLRLEYSTTDPRDIFSMIRNTTSNITFLDIEMPGITGLEVAGLISSHTAIIFTTSHIEFAVEAFDKDAVDFLVKPVSYSRFLKAVMKAQARTQTQSETIPENDSYFYIHGNRKTELIKINFADVLYLESMENYVRISTAQESHITYLTLKEFELKLNRNNFFKVHKSFVVNLDGIKRHVNNHLEMENGFEVPIGANRRQELLTKLKSRTLTSDRRKGKDSEIS